jgi:hypothetical protein
LQDACGARTQKHTHAVRAVARRGAFDLLGKTIGLQAHLHQAVVAAIESAQVPWQLNGINAIDRPDPCREFHRLEVAGLETRSLFAQGIPVGLQALTQASRQGEGGKL